MTRTPNGNSSRRRLSETASRPNLDAAYGPTNGKAPRPATELMLTMRPRDTLRSGRNACVTATTPIKFTSRTRRSSSSGNSSSGPAAGIPALFTSAMSGVVPRARSTSPRTRVMLAVSVTSIRRAVTPSRVSAISSSARRTVPKTRRHYHTSVHPGNLRTLLRDPVHDTHGVVEIPEGRETEDRSQGVAGGELPGRALGVEGLDERLEEPTQ